MKLWLTARCRAGLARACQELGKAGESVPPIPYESVPNFLKLPPDMHLGEAAGVAINSKKHVSSLRARIEQGPAYGNTESQILEFGRRQVRPRDRKNLYAWSFAHTVRVDKEDNIWATDKGSDMIIKLSPEGRVMMVFWAQAGSLR